MLWGDGNMHRNLREAMSITWPSDSPPLCIGSWNLLLFFKFDMRRWSSISQGPVYVYLTNNDGLTHCASLPFFIYSQHCILSLRWPSRLYVPTAFFQLGERPDFSLLLFIMLSMVVNFE